MKYDVYKIDGKAIVYPRGSLDEYGCLPDTKPLYECSEDGDWYEWCESRVGKFEDDSIRVCDLVYHCPARYIEELSIKAQSLMDRYINEGKEIGLGELEIDRNGMSYTFRSSADWKEDEILYTFDQPLRWTDDEVDISDRYMRVRDNLVQLWGMSQAIYELGLTLVFDKSFKVSIRGSKEIWKTTFEY